ncbi:histidyl-tRNA synthetase [Candidatus Nitromaritima sp. SCGC AAA799-C22]|nr:histidyl-tRNA synthetase [Candidatus Nitromaritima sp. SCGC AAA799-C22]
MKIQAIRGVKDILPDEIEKWQWVENQAHTIFARYGFKEIRPPIFEKTNLFSRSIGETTDIVEKEMYTFEDRSGEKVTLRPEGTASVVRAFIEHKMYAAQSVQKLYYLGPMFRYERPQAGRFRQFYQIGVEAMGSHHPAVDGEVMIMLMDFFRALGLTGLELQLNSLGCSTCRPEYREVLKDAIRNHLSDLCDNCNQRYERNPLRVLDCKAERDREIAAGLPKTADHLCAECKVHFDEVRSLLDSTKTPYTLNHQLVRGLDYYTHTTFEVSSSELGAQNAICGGGRYNTLVEEFEGPPTPCFGFALGLERLISVVPFDKAGNFGKRPDVFIVCLGEEARERGFSLAHELRTKKLSVERDYDGGSMKSQMRKANKSDCRFALIVGENEIKSGKYQLKDMAGGGQTEISADSCAGDIKKQLENIA